MNTIRPFRWHDWGRFQRLAKHGLSLDVETSLTKGTGILRNSILASLPADVGGLPTYVLQHGPDAAIGQLRHQPGDSHARIAFAAPVPVGDDLALWERLLEALTFVAGERGAVNVIAEVEEGSPAFHGLRKVGFAVYARQEIWSREPLPVTDGTLSNVRPCRPADVFNATVLYSNVVPGLLRQVEPSPVLAGAAFVLTDGDDAVGLVTSQHGPHGYLLEAYLHPAAEHRADEAISGTLRHINARRQHIYFRVRRYQGWLGQRLEKHDFKMLGRQAMMVKHTTARVEQPAFQPLPAINSGAKASTPSPLIDTLRPPTGARSAFGHSQERPSEADVRLTLLGTHKLR